MSYLVYLSSMLLFALSMCFTPGPNNAMAMAIGLDKGFKAALPLCFGAAIGANVTLLLLGLGLAELFIRFPVVYEFLRYAGALYMLWLAWKISGLPLPWAAGSAGLKAKQERKNLRGELSGPESKADSETADESRNDKERTEGVRPLTFLQAFMFQLVNVKVWLTNVIVISNYVGTGEGVWARLTLAIVLFTVLGTVAIATWAAGGMFMRHFLTSDGMRRANYVFAAFLVFSVLLLFV